MTYWRLLALAGFAAWLESHSQDIGRSLFGTGCGMQLCRPRAKWDLGLRVSHPLYGFPTFGCALLVRLVVNSQVASRDVPVSLET